MRALKKSVRRIARKLGYEIVRYDPVKHPLARRKKLLETYNIDLIFDVGANVGQYGEQLREIGYKGRIVSFEPLSAAFEELEEKAKNDKSWEIHNFALGDKEETSVINIAGNSYSSSLLSMLPSHIQAAPSSAYIGQEDISIKTLDSIFTELAGIGREIYLKIDTQGFEKNVLKGADTSLQSINSLQLEMSLTPLYQDELLFNQMYEFLYQKGYRLVAVEPGFADKDTGQLLQLDGIFHRM